MIWLQSALVALLLWCLLALMWRREGRRQGAVPRWSAVIPVATLVALAGGGLYLALGYSDNTGEWLADQQRLKPAVREIMAGSAPGDVAADENAAAVARVLQRELAHEPTAPGWYALALIYNQIEWAPQAVEAARRAFAMAPDSARMPARLLLARSLVLAEKGRLTPEAEQHLRAILDQYPEHDGAWTLLALSASQSGRHDLAVEAFESLLSRHGDGEVAPMLRRGLEQARRQQDSQGLFGHINVRVRAGEQVEPGGTLFLFVRRPGGQGQPLAARRVLVDRFPATVVLGPGDWLQAFPEEGTELVVGARYALGPGASVENSSLRASPVPLTPRDTGLGAVLRLGGNL
jgi:cytochrome c-type biogenesis protein CcmH